MTRAAAQALAAGAGLRENCVVVITDGPVIGTTGNTSATEVELNPVSPTEFGTSARVHTAFATEAWVGSYSIADNVFHKLADDWNNIVSDVDLTADSVMTQFPWHLGSVTFRDNTFNDVVLTAWSALTATALVSDNRVDNSTIDLTGLAGTFTFQRNTAVQTSIQLTGAGIINILNNTLNGGAWAKTGDATLLVSNGEHIGGIYNLSATGGGYFFQNNRWTNPNLNLGGTAGNVTYSSNTGSGGSHTRNAAHAATWTVTNNVFAAGITLSNTAAQVGTVNLTANTFTAGIIAANGAGAISLTNSYFNSIGFTTAVGSTRGLSISGSSAADNTQITQNRTGGTLIDTITGATLRRATINLNGAVDPGAAQTVINDAEVTFATVTITDPAAGVVVQASRITQQASLNVQAGGGLQDRLDLANGVLNTGAFTSQGCALTNGLVKTMTANNINSLGNIAFDNWVAV